MTSIKWVDSPPLPKDPSGPVLPWLVVVGAAGAGGARQLAAFVAALPADLPAAVLVSLHAPPARVAALTATLRRLARLPVTTAYEGEALHAGVCYVAGWDHHLAVAGVTAHVTATPVPRGRTIDLLFRGAAAAGGPRVVGVVLAGASQDGAEGLGQIVRAGGVAMVIEARGGAKADMPVSARRAIAARTASSPALLAAEVVGLLQTSR